MAIDRAGDYVDLLDDFHRAHKTFKWSTGGGSIPGVIGGQAGEGRGIQSAARHSFL